MAILHGHPEHLARCRLQMCGRLISDGVESPYCASHRLQISPKAREPTPAPPLTSEPDPVSQALTEPQVKPWASKRKGRRR